MANRVEYIKIARIDQNGNDNTITLESLSKLTIPYSNGNNAVYPIESITRRRDFFLYQVGPANFTPNPNDSGSLSYDFTGSLGGNSTEIDLGVGGVAVPFPTVTGTGSSVSFLYNTLEDKIELGTYPEKAIHIKTPSFSVTSSAEVFVDLYKADAFYTPSSIIKLTNTPAIQGGSIKGPFTREVSVSGSAYPGDTFFLGASANSFPFAGGPFVKVGQVDGSKLNPLFIFITSSAESGPNIETIPEPFLTSQFYGGDCDVLLNNINQYQSNPFLQDLDYSTNPNVPVNFQLIISGTAARGTVPESYYTALSQTNIRYNGSKNQSSNFNIYDPTAGTSSFGNPINIGTYGSTPSVSSLDVNIYEFEWGGGTTPEILDYGAVKLGKILQASSKNLVKTVDPSQGAGQILTPSRRGTTVARARNYRVVFSAPVGEEYPPFTVSTSSISQTGVLIKNFWLTSQSISDYTHILNGNNIPNTEISMFMYPNSTAGSNPTLPSSTRILTTEWGVPSISSYALTSSNSSEYGSINSASSPRRFITLNRNIHISKVKTDSAGFYSAGKQIKPNHQTLGDQINVDLNNGERWFVTLYNEFEFPEGSGDYNSPLTTGSLSPFNEGITQYENGTYSNELGYKGVYEIAGTYDNAGSFSILTYDDFPNFGGIKKIGGGAAGNSLGMLIWKAKSVGKGEYAIVQDNITGGVGAGAFINKYSPRYLTENFEEITREYGSNTI
tara:strand:- start:28 stop:2205 length:2178 start_codon:yes stop_codon:yes gene_type:complete